MSRDSLAAWGTSTPGPNDWRHDAACLGHDAELFFPVGTSKAACQQIAEAVAVCRACPVRSDCLNHALDEHIVDGVWGGMAEDERTKLKRRQSRVRRAVERGQPEPVQRVQPVATLDVITACRDAGKTWDQIAELLGTSWTTCREVYLGLRQSVPVSIEETAMNVAEMVDTR